VDFLTRDGPERLASIIALILDGFTICVGYRPVALLGMLIPAGYSANPNL